MVISLSQLGAQSPYLSPSDFTAAFDITVDHTKVSGVTDHNDFPLLVEITNASLRNTANGGSMQNMSGYDILFTGDCDQVLPHEIESYTEATGKLVAWVRIPVLYATQATSLKMNYGNATVVDNTSSSATWIADHETIHHLHSDFLDATANNIDGTNNGSTDVTGQIANGQVFDGSNDRIETSYSNTLTQLTMSAWVTAVDYIVPNRSAITAQLHNSSAPNGPKLNFFQMNGGTPRIYLRNDASSNNALLYATTFTPNQKYHVAATWDGATSDLILYVDGVQDIADLSFLSGSLTPDVFRIGRTQLDDGSFNYHEGMIDEVRLLNTVLSPDRIKTEFNNQNSPGTFYSVVAGTSVNNNDIVSGNLFEDLDADGVKDAGEVAHSNATIQLLDDVNENSLVDGGDVVVDTDPTDVNGDYSFSIPKKSLESEVLVNENDAEQETNTGNTFVTSGDMDMGFLGVGSPYTCGFRYDNLSIPNGAIVTKAYLEYVAFSSLAGAVEVTIDGNDVDNAAIFADGTGTYGISGRTRTSEKVNWSPAAWTAEQTYYSPDISNVVQEIIDRPGWISGNAMAFIVEGGLNKREAYGWSTDPDKAAKLHIEYYVPPVSEYYLVNIDETTLPPNFAYTTASEYDFNFTSCSSESSTGNDFGVQLTDICGNGLDDNNDGNIDEPYPSGTGENMILWLKASDGFSPTTWEDQSPNENDATVFGDPTFVANSLNYNPGINFDGNDHVEITLPELAWDNGTHSVAMFIVYEPSVATSAIGIFGNQSATDATNFSASNGQWSLGSWSTVQGFLYGARPHLGSFILDEEDNVGGGLFETYYYREGIAGSNTTYNETSAASVNPIFHIGKSGTNAASLYFEGDIHEIILYYEDNGNAAITDSQRLKIQSYLAAKYGITLSHDYTDSQ